VKPSALATLVCVATPFSSDFFSSAYLTWYETEVDPRRTEPCSRDFRPRRFAAPGMVRQDPSLAVSLQK
jgi:hypothetical protein